MASSSSGARMSMPVNWVSPKGSEKRSAKRPVSSDRPQARLRIWRWAGN